MHIEQHIEELTALQTIAESLNTSNNMQEMLYEVLPKLLQVTGLTSGWIFLTEESPDFSLAAHHNLPPALCWGDLAPMCTGKCWCLNRYWSGQLQEAVNIIECKRLEDAITQQWGDTQGIDHHATIPLRAGNELFGLLNVAAPGKDKFSDEELALLQSVALQIGTAIKRTKLFDAQKKRAQNYVKFGEISRRLGSLLDLDRIADEVIRMLASEFEWPTAAFFMKEGTDLSLRAVSANHVMRKEWRTLSPQAAGPAGTAFNESRVVTILHNTTDCPELQAAGLPAFASCVSVPLLIRNEVTGVLLVSSPNKRQFDQQDVEILQVIVEHVGLAIENARLHAQREEIAKMEERNRLARDLHDSVSQTLFSLTLTARAAATIVEGVAPAATRPLQDIQTLAQDALREMRSLILQLRPAGLEQGLLLGLQRYGESLGLTVQVHMQGVHQVPRFVEETLWRIGQESLNNVSKHAETKQVSITLGITDTAAMIEITDNGSGFVIGDGNCAESVGLVGMRERIEILSGTLTVHSLPGAGTRITASIPFSIIGAGRNEVSQ